MRLFLYVGSYCFLFENLDTENLSNYNSQSYYYLNNDAGKLNGAAALTCKHFYETVDYNFYSGVENFDSEIKTSGSGVQTFDSRVQTFHIRVQTFDSTAQTFDSTAPTFDSYVDTYHSVVQTFGSYIDTYHNYAQTFGTRVRSGGIRKGKKHLFQLNFAQNMKNNENYDFSPYRFLVIIKTYSLII